MISNKLQCPRPSFSSVMGGAAPTFAPTVAPTQTDAADGMAGGLGGGEEGNAGSIGGGPVDSVTPDNAVGPKMPDEEQESVPKPEE